MCIRDRKRVTAACSTKLKIATPSIATFVCHNVTKTACASRKITKQLRIAHRCIITFLIIILTKFFPEVVLPLNQHYLLPAYLVIVKNNSIRDILNRVYLINICFSDRIAAEKSFKKAVRARTPPPRPCCLLGGGTIFGLAAVYLMPH